MIMGKLCCVFNIPSHYRKDIYRAIDEYYDVDWYFEEYSGDIKVFDNNLLKRVTYFQHKPFIGRFYLMKGLLAKIVNEKYDNYLLIGTPLCLSIWILCLYIKLKYRRSKIYFWTHGWYGKETALESFFKKVFYRLADELVVYGNYAKELLVKNGFKRELIHVIHNSLSYDEQLKIRNQAKPTNIYYSHFGNNNPVLLFVGRLTPIKKLDMLVEAIRLLKHNEYDYNLVLVGDGTELSKLQNIVREYQLTSQVWFYGESYSELVNSELIFNADLCVAPGNVGLTAIHALMYGCPVITHDDFKYQMPEFEAIKDNKTGLFFKKGSIESLVETIMKWFIIKGGDRETVRQDCYEEIDRSWNPNYQMSILKSILS